MIYGDNPQKINEREDKLGLKTYSYAPQISAVVQSGNMYVYAVGNPVMYADPSGEVTQKGNPPPPSSGYVPPKGKKPEHLIKRVLELSTKPGDLVLDSFLGSGTTAAVAHKMGRRWIGVELGEQAYTHCKVRLDQVIDGEQGGISKAVDWHGGSGYHFYELAESLLVQHPVLPIMQVNPHYTFEMLCEAICKIEGFKYTPEGAFHGYSSEKRFIHITKEFINAEYIKAVSATLSDDQSLLIYGTKIQSNLYLPENIEVKKIPKDLLQKCFFESEVR